MAILSLPVPASALWLRFPSSPVATVAVKPSAGSNTNRSRTILRAQWPTEIQIAFDRRSATVLEPSFFCDYCAANQEIKMISSPISILIARETLCSDTSC